MKILRCLRVCLGAAFLLAGAASPGAEPTLVAGNSAFAAELYGKIAPPQGNLFFSPYSISLALALAYAGARGQTAAAMARVLHLPADPAAAAQGFAELTGHFAALASDDVTLTVANSLWYQKNLLLRPSYLRVARDSYQAIIQAEDFAREPAAAGADINRWVSDATQGKIPNLVGPGTVGPSTRVVLANAIYFKGAWASSFQRNRTQPAPFFLAPGTSASVPTMHQKTKYRWVQLPGFRMLELPYEGYGLTFVLILPDAVDGLSGIERQLGGGNLVAWLDRLNAARPTEIALSLPRFTVSTGFDLTAPLRELGLASAFDPERSDFTGIAAGPGFFLSQVLHKAYVEVNEEGTVAAAATGAVMMALAVEQTREFRVDHPFLFLIQENRTGTLLFFGRITDPRP